MPDLPCTAAAQWEPSGEYVGSAERCARGLSGAPLRGSGSFSAVCWDGMV
jgi:hypothetical protein